MQQWASQGLLRQWPSAAVGTLRPGGGFSSRDRALPPLYVAGEKVREGAAATQISTQTDEARSLRQARGVFDLSADVSEPHRHLGCHCSSSCNSYRASKQHVGMQQLEPNIQACI